MRATTIIQRVEGVAVAVASCVAFVHLGFAWWWMLALFLLFDASAIGYLHNTRTGAWTYNVVHSYVGPVAVGAAALVIDAEGLRFLAPIWLLHIGVDRAFGYGLKEQDSFRRSHLDL